MVGPKVCDAPTIGEEELEAVTVKAINKVVHSSSAMRDTLKANIREVISRDKTSEKIEALNKVMNDKQEELMNLAKHNKDYSSLASEIEELRAEKQKVLVEKSQVESTKRRIKEMDEFLEKESTKLTEYDEGMVRSYIQGIKIYDDRFLISFKAGIDIGLQR